MIVCFPDLLIGDQETRIDLTAIDAEKCEPSICEATYLEMTFLRKPHGFLPLAPLNCHISRIAASSMPVATKWFADPSWENGLVNLVVHHSMIGAINRLTMSDNPPGTCRTILLRKMPMGNHANSERRACLQSKLLI